MLLLTKENEYIDFDLQESKLLGEGAFGKVFKLSPEKCLKVISDPDSLPEAEEIMSFFKEHKLPNFYEVVNLYYTYRGLFKAYEMKYYEKHSDLLLYRLMEFYLENFMQTAKDIDTLSQNNIKVCDLRGENVVITDDKVVIIDADCFDKSVLDKNLLKVENQTQLKWLYINLLLRELLDMSNYNSDIMYNIRQGLYSIFMGNTPEEVYNQIKSYKRPIDLVRKLERKR